MNDYQRKIITETVPVLKENGVTLTTHFYKRMFQHQPELKNMFNMGNQNSGKQQQALAMAVLAYAEHIANPGVLQPALERIGHKHVSLDIRPEHYPIVGNHLLASIKEVLGEAATPEILDAWEAAYNQLADLMIRMEADMYENHTAKKGGWTGWRPFKVVKKTVESTEITSFYLYPSDGGKVVTHVPGQFISLRLFLPDLGLNQARQYSISSVPDSSHYRISVKREQGFHLNTNGMISNHLHDFVKEGDVVDLTAPTGNFVLDKDLSSPVMFISGGVGLTPLISMLQTAVETHSGLPITWVHACRNQSVHAFGDQINELRKNNPNLEQHVFYDVLTETDKERGVAEGPLDREKLKSLPHHPDTLYYVCGPAGFIKKQYSELTSLGIDKEAVSYEEFGPQVLQLN